MGASEFSTTARGKTAKDAFSAAVEEAQYENGHGGYTGTIAEKRGFKMVTPKLGESPREAVSRLMDDDSSFVQDKWGDAGCVSLGPDKNDPNLNVYLFFGWASS